MNTRYPNEIDMEEHIYLDMGEKHVVLSIAVLAIIVVAASTLGNVNVTEAKKSYKLNSLSGRSLQGECYR